MDRQVPKCGDGDDGEPEQHHKTGDIAISLLVCLRSRSRHRGARTFADLSYSLSWPGSYDLPTHRHYNKPRASLPPTCTSISSMTPTRPPRHHVRIQAGRDVPLGKSEMSVDMCHCRDSEYAIRAGLGRDWRSSGNARLLEGFRLS